MFWFPLFLTERKASIMIYILLNIREGIKLIQFAHFKNHKTFMNHLVYPTRVWTVIKLSYLVVIVHRFQMKSRILSYAANIG